MRRNPWRAYDAWEARDRTLLEAAAIRARRLGYPEDPAAPDPTRIEPLEGQLELAPSEPAMSAVPSVPPDDEDT